MPAPPAGRQLLAGKVVLVTAAAGTGIGHATAQRCLEEGATVVLSDAHERRLNEAADELTDLAGGERPLTVTCDVTNEDQVQAMVGRQRRHPRTARRRRQQRRPGRHRRARRDDRRAVAQGARHHAHRHHALHAGDAAPHVRARRRRDREQRVRARVARPGRSSPLRGGQGRRHGADPHGRHRGRAAWRAGQRGGSVPRDASLPREGDDRRAARRADASARRSAAPRSRGRSRP